LGDVHFVSSSSHATFIIDFKEDLEMKGSETNMYKKLRNYIDKSLYADRKQDEHFSFKLNDKTVNVYYGKGMDLTKGYSQ
jgi:hypothetical protein